MKSVFEFQHKYIPGEAGKPTVVALHGTGGTENDLIPFAQNFFPGSPVLAPRGRVLERGMPRFFKRIAEGVFDLEDLALQTAALGDFIEQAGQEYGFDAQRIWAIGFSNGANIAASLLLSRSELFQSGGAVLLRAMTPFEPQDGEATLLSNVPVFLASGDSDPMVPHENVEHLADVLRQRGADVTLNWAHSGHNLTSADIEAVQSWLQSKL